MLLNVIIFMIIDHDIIAVNIYFDIISISIYRYSIERMKFVSLFDSFNALHTL